MGGEKKRSFGLVLAVVWINACPRDFEANSARLPKCALAGLCKRQPPINYRFLPDMNST